MQLNVMREQWASFVEVMAGGIMARAVDATLSYRFGPFALHRFITKLDLREENHLGEAIVRDDGTLEYLKTYRLSRAQSRRAFLLSQLAEHRWNLDASARSLNSTRDALILRLEKAGFGYLLKPHVIEEARRRSKRRR